MDPTEIRIIRKVIAEVEPFKDSAPNRSAVGNFEMNSQRVMKFIAPQGKAALESAFSKVMKKIFFLYWAG
jgi:hypothetical protein